jgi:hypothetical protein
MSRIDTGIANTNCLPKPSTIRGRAAVRWKNLASRFFNATNWKCKVAPPGDGLSMPEFRKGDLLRKLSKGQMDPLDTMLGLLRLTSIQSEPLSQLKISQYQAQRMLDNLQAHGEMFTVLKEHIEALESLDVRLSIGDPVTKYLDGLKRVLGNYEHLAQQVMSRAGHSNAALEVQIDPDHAARLRHALDRAWAKYLTEQAPDAFSAVERMLLRGKDERRAMTGTHAQKKFARDLEHVRDTLDKHHVIADAEIRNLLTRALRKAWGEVSDRFVDKIVCSLGMLPEHIFAKRLPPLLEAMSDVIDGVGSAKRDFRRALLDIARAAKEAQQHDRIETPPDRVVPQDHNGDLPEAPAQAPENELPKAPVQAPERKLPEVVAPITDADLNEVSGVEAGQPPVSKADSMVSEADSMVSERDSMVSERFHGLERSSAAALRRCRQ